MTKATKAKATQNFVPVKDIRDGVAILEDHSLRSVLIASSLNFALKTSDEQMSTLLQFQDFLNSLDFSVQFLVQSRDLDIRPYVALLEEKETEQVNDLLKVQTREYINFIKVFTENSDIMTKNFFVIVSYDPAIIGKSGSISSILKRKKKTDIKEETPDERALFEEHSTQLSQRVAVVQQGLARSGVRMIKLGTDELVELYYKTFNPGDLEKPAHLIS